MTTITYCVRLSFYSCNFRMTQRDLDFDSPFLHAEHVLVVQNLHFITQNTPATGLRIHM